MACTAIHQMDMKPLWQSFLLFFYGGVDSPLLQAIDEVIETTVLFFKKVKQLSPSLLSYYGVMYRWWQIEQKMKNGYLKKVNV